MKNFKTKSNLLLLAAAITTATLAGKSFAATETDDFDVFILVESACAITANDLDFGTYNALSAVPVLVNTSTIDVTCNLLSPHEVGIGSGSNSTDVTTRKMIIQSGTGGETLDYTLGCLAAGIPGIASPVTTACALNWGETTGVGGDSMLLVGIGLPVPIPMAGTVPALQNVPVGTYKDTLTATVTF